MIESELLPRRTCEDLLGYAQRAARASGVRDVELSLTASGDALTRFANNVIHQNVAERSVLASVRVVLDHRTARASTNRLDADGMAAAVRGAIDLARSSQPDPELPELYSGNGSADGERVSAGALNNTAEMRARGVRNAIRLVEEQSQTAAGIYAVGETSEAILNTAGVFRYHRETMTQFSITAMAEDSSGWAKASSAGHDDIDPAALAAQAILKASRSAKPREVPPGKYTVILEPAAVLDLVGQIFPDFSATALADQRSFLNDRMGTQLFGENISIWDHAGCPLQSGALFDGEGVPRQMLTLVEKGRVKDLAWSRTSAAKAGRLATGHGFPLPSEHGESPVNIVMAGGSRSIDDLVKSTERGILVTRLWYIREVEPREKVMTGMTRDGTFLIENGEIVCGLRNFRFNQSVVELLNNVEAMSESVRASGEEAFDMVVPGMKVNGFHFTEVTKF